MKLHPLFHRLHAAAEDGTGGAAAADRGDDFVATLDDAPAPAAAPEKKPAPPAAATEDDVAAEDDADIADDADADADDADKQPKAKKDARLPLARHKEILQRERAQREAVERELAKYRQGAQIAESNAELTDAENKLLAAEKEYAALLTDGNVDKAAEKMGEIRRLDRDINSRRTAVEIQAAQARAVEQVRYDTTVERLEEAYPRLNPDHDDFDKDTTSEVLELKEAIQLKGYTPSQALQRAVKYVFGAETTKQERAVTAEARVDKAAADKALKAVDSRVKAQREKNIETALKTPANTAAAGMDSDKLGGKLDGKAVMKMSQEQFAKLTEADLEKLRGDTV